MITTEQIKELRNDTGVSVMQCKKALEEAEGNMEKALMVLKKKSADIASKKAEREVKDGLIVIKTANLVAPGRASGRAGSKAVVVILNCETDFVAKNEDFIKLANEIAEKAIAEGPEIAKEAAQEMINPVIQKIGENIQLNDITEIEGENLGIYIHNGKAGVVAVLSGGNPELAKNVAMHIAAMKPEYINRDSIDENAKKMALELFGKEVEGMDKPKDIKERILQGKVDAYFKERILLEQPFIKDETKTIGQLLEQASSPDEPIEIRGFHNYSLNN